MSSYLRVYWLAMLELTQKVHRECYITDNRQNTGTQMFSLRLVLAYRSVSLLLRHDVIMRTVRALRSRSSGRLIAGFIHEGALNRVKSPPTNRQTVGKINLAAKYNRLFVFAFDIRHYLHYRFH